MIFTGYIMEGGGGKARVIGGDQWHFGIGTISRSLLLESKTSRDRACSINRTLNLVATMSPSNQVPLQLL